MVYKNLHLIKYFCDLCIFHNLYFSEAVLHMLVPFRKEVSGYVTPYVSKMARWSSRQFKFCVSQSSRAVPPLSELAAYSLLASLLEMETTAGHNH